MYTNQCWSDIRIGTVGLECRPAAPGVKIGSNQLTKLVWQAHIALDSNLLKFVMEPQ
jgi:hypothetical protein